MFYERINGWMEIAILSQYLALSRAVNRSSISAIHLAATDHCEFMTLVAGKRRCLLMTGDDDVVYDTKPQRCAEDNVTQW